MGENPHTLQLISGGKQTEVEIEAERQEKIAEIYELLPNHSLEELEEIRLSILFKNYIQKLNEEP